VGGGKSMRQRISVQELQNAIEHTLQTWQFTTPIYGPVQKYALQLAAAHPEFLCSTEGKGLYYKIQGEDIWEDLYTYIIYTAVDIVYHELGFLPDIPEPAFFVLRHNAWMHGNALKIKKVA
jgi:hypothetical protein